jgi:hypothetical protein
MQYSWQSSLVSRNSGDSVPAEVMLHSVSLGRPVREGNEGRGGEGEGGGWGRRRGLLPDV